ncbi:MAG: Undecaprenyl-diphosphatase [Candidatus Tokpelaia hoelldobleri]|uniref:Undecaprenyl-diphosphatase n=1 Tax=Candidatus Tokpelaia hoelldobleri TaxID=1902579 RepID=A0A1U9JV17_9HYPH|nr:MAG: Undecaprenyl-diphosphatase [Candidatus Tokpelaia hoelldoblerii]
MDFWQIFNSAFLGVIEGFTEFIPVSSTGHLILAGHFLNFHSPNNTFQVLIQLGPILAILSVYFGRLLHIVKTLPASRESQHFTIGVLVAFLPAAVIGVLAHKTIKTVLMESPMTVCISLIIGGIVLLWVDRLPLKPRYHNVMRYPWWLCVCIGFFQCLAMIPGVSRSGATIVGALLLGADKRSAAEFSFFLAMPTMVGAFAYDLMKNYSDLQWNDTMSIVIGFVVAFIAGVFVVRHLLDYISRHGYALFGWWRLIAGGFGLVALMIWG